MLVAEELLPSVLSMVVVLSVDAADDPIDMLVVETTADGLVTVELDKLTGTDEREDVDGLLDDADVERVVIDTATDALVEVVELTRELDLVVEARLFVDANDKEEDRLLAESGNLLLVDEDTVLRLDVLRRLENLLWLLANPEVRELLGILVEARCEELVITEVRF